MESETENLTLSDYAADSVSLVREPTLVDSIAQQVTNKLEDKLEDILYAALQTTFDRIFKGQVDTMIHKMQAVQQEFLDNLGHNNVVSSQSCSQSSQSDCVQHAASLPDRLVGMKASLPTVRGEHSQMNKVQCKGRLKMHCMDKLHMQNILQQDHSSCQRKLDQLPNDRHDSEMHQDNDAIHSNADEFSSINSIPGSIASECMGANGQRIGMNKLREETMTKLVTQCVKQELPSDVDLSVVEFMCRIWKILGIIPWSHGRCANWYRYFTILLLLSSTSWSIYILVQNPASRDKNIVHTLLSICTLLSLLAVRSVCELVGPTSDLLVHHAGACEFVQEWTKVGLWHLKIATGIWICTGLVIIAVYVSMDAVDVISSGALFYQSGIFFGVVHCMSQLLAFLDLMVDAYCLQCFDGLACSHAVYHWNVIQSLLRSVALAMENCLVCLKMAIMLALIWLMTQLIDTVQRLQSMSLQQLASEMQGEGSLSCVTLAFLSVLVVVPGSMLLFINAAALTEHCSRVPALLNSMVSEPEDQMNLERQYLVLFIVNSDAGFYIKGVRLTAIMMVKACYLLGAIFCTMGTTAISNSRA